MQINYDRYIGSSVTRLLGMIHETMLWLPGELTFTIIIKPGPFILAFGGLILIASCGILGFQAFGHNYDNLPQDGPIKHQYAEE